MNISPVSFGRTVKVNAPRSVAQKVANLVNNFDVHPEEENVQKQLKEIFFDRTKDGFARAIPLDDKTSYILTGEESKKVNVLRTIMEDDIESAGRYYGAGRLLDIAMETAGESFDKDMDLLIAETEDGTIIDVDFDKTKNILKSINLVG